MKLTIIQGEQVSLLKSISLDLSLLVQGNNNQTFELNNGLLRPYDLCDFLDTKIFEHPTDIIPIAYKLILGREVDVVGLEDYSKSIESGSSGVEIAEFLINSEEFMSLDPLRRKKGLYYLNLIRLRTFGFLHSVDSAVYTKLDDPTAKRIFALSCRILERSMNVRELEIWEEFYKTTKKDHDRVLWARSTAIIQERKGLIDRTFITLRFLIFPLIRARINERLSKEISLIESGMRSVTIGIGEI